ncbi:Uncharacterized protein TCM_039403 [Theobroma cacao]|uniref:Uncharacterized protein n=1 Tax=Theobroma cacao TaxID=3641 RepID=A0A061GQ64_THECC|nr:Uncharacterized protein TCM_039403 [Theobroma cacao]
MMFHSKESLESSESLESEDIFDIQEVIRNFLWQRSEERFKEKVKEAIAKGDIHPRKISAIRHFPSSCGIGVVPLSKEEYLRIQQAWIKGKMKKSQEVEEDSEEDSSMCSDQGNDDPKDT